MVEVLQSIKSKWAGMIFGGIKTKELRKSKPVGIEYPFKVYVYETMLTDAGAVIGEYICNGITTSNLPEYFEKDSCVPLEDIKKYMGKGKISAWNVTEPVLYAKPVPLSEFGLKRPPQSWCYLKKNNKVDRKYRFIGQSYKGKTKYYVTSDGWMAKAQKGKFIEMGYIEDNMDIYCKLCNE